MAQQDVLTLRVETALAWDANVFRLPESVADPQLARGISGKADRISTTSVGLQFNKTYAQQSLLFDLASTATRYDKFVFLNRDSQSYRGQWQWHLTPRISGTLSTDRSETAVPFDETRDLEANSLITSRKNASVAAALFGGWQLLAGVQQVERKHARPFPQLPDSTQDGVEAGIRYTAASQRTISVLRRSQRGSVLAQSGVVPLSSVTGGFSYEETELRAAWPVSGKSTLNGRLARVARRHQDSPQRDFSGLAGEFSHAWTPTGRLSLNVALQRSLDPFILGTRSSYVVQDGLSVTPVWQLSERVSITASASVQARDYLGEVVAQPDPSRRDTLRSASISAVWTPMRAVTIRTSVRRDRRSSNEADFSYQSTVASVNAAFSF